jgi:hypothetical protein
VGIGGVNCRFHDVVVQQPIDRIDGLALG